MNTLQHRAGQLQRLVLPQATRKLAEAYDIPRGEYRLDGQPART